MSDSAIKDQAQPRPEFSEAEAATLAFDLYGLTCSVRELTSERDQNFHIQTESGEQFVLKIKPPLLFSKTNADQVLDALARTLTESPLLVTAE